MIKSYTDISQSKKLSEILPPESADMIYPSGFDFPFVWIEKPKKDKNAIPCWNLAALIEVLPSIEGFKPVIDLDINQIRYEGKYRDELCFNGNNLIDACYEMILCLNELYLL